MPAEPDRTLRTDKKLRAYPDDSAAALRGPMAVAVPGKNPGVSDAAAPVTVPSPKQRYTLLRLLGVGDLSDVHLATAGGFDYVLKISRVEGAPPLLESEGQLLTALLGKAGGSHYARYYPALVESFPARDRIQKHVNVFPHYPGLYTLDQVRQRHATGLDGRHLAWIFKRLLTAAGFAHRCGWVHGAVLPPHALLQTEEHGAQLVGWVHAVQAGERIKTISTKFKEWYPPEVLRKHAAGPATDIFLAARCVVYLAGGEPLTNQMPATVPHAMQQFIHACLRDDPAKRPGDAWELLERFDRLLHGLYGPPTFHHLTMT